ncbi:MAG: hypothetical protein WD070_01820 [Pirellulaceae bacterium]
MAYDYSHPEVWTHYLDTLREACRRYDLDGVELNPKLRSSLAL